MANAATNWLLMSPDGHLTYTDGWLSICAFSMELDVHSKFSTQKLIAPAMADTHCLRLCPILRGG